MKHSALTFFDCMAFITFNWLYSAMRSISSKRSFNFFSCFWPKSRTFSPIPTERTKLVTIQRSKGYQTRPSFSVQQIGELISFIKQIKPEVICMVDNCYGEFVEEKEPLEAGADMIVGSLIKNPGGGLAPIGGYIVGKRTCIEQAAYRLTSPGLGKEVGASLGVIQSLYQGLFLAPTVTAAALKSAVFAANIYESLGFVSEYQEVYFSW